MKRTTLIAGAATTALAAGAMTIAIVHHNRESDDERLEVEAVLSAPISLAEAIRAVEATGVGRAVQAGAEAEDGLVYYAITTVEGDDTSEWFVDMTTARMSADIEQEGDGEHDGFTPDSDLTSLPEAIEVAKSLGGGAALEAEYEYEDGAARVVVEVVLPSGEVKHVVLDAYTASVIGASTL